MSKIAKLQNEKIQMLEIADSTRGTDIARQALRRAAEIVLEIATLKILYKSIKTRKQWQK